jgi:hypothetical protein
LLGTQFPKFELTIKLKTVKALGLTVSPKSLFTAGEGSNNDAVGFDANVAFWPIASFRCDAEFGRYRGTADIDHAAPIRLDL